MNINILRYSLLCIAGGQEVDHTFVKCSGHVTVSWNSETPLKIKHPLTWSAQRRRTTTIEETNVTLLSTRC